MYSTVCHAYSIYIGVYKGNNSILVYCTIEYTLSGILLLDTQDNFLTPHYMLYIRACPHYNSHCIQIVNKADSIQDCAIYQLYNDLGGNRKVNNLCMVINTRYFFMCC